VVSAGNIQEVTAPLNGKHMRANAALAISLAELLGISKKNSIASLTTFPGLSRRFEYIGNIGSLPIRSDYGHHPAEIAATIAGAREAFPKASIIALFEAHMPQRLHAFFEDFAQALATADIVVISKPFIPEGRDSSGSIEDAENLTRAIIAHGTPTKIALDNHLLEHVLTEYTEVNNSPYIAILFSAGTLDARMRAIVNKK
jgi:UDP-N-acetylmuramate--alanine ligase